MAYDPSVISSIGENVMRPVVDAPARAMQLGDLINKQQISKIALKEDQEEQQTYGALKGYIDQNKLDMSKPEDMNKIAAEASRMNPKVGMKLQREFTAAQTGQAALTRENIALYTEKLDAIANAALPFYQQAQQLKAQGKSSQEIDAAMLPGLQQTIKTMQAVKLRNGEPLMDAEMSQKAAALVSSPNVMQNLEQMLTTTKSSREWLMKQEEKVRGEKRDEASNRETKIEVRNGKPHNILFEKTTGREIKDLGETTTAAAGRAGEAGPVSPKVSEVYAAMADQGLSFPSGMRSVKAQRDTVNGLIKAHPNDTAEQIASRLRSGQLGLKGASTELGVVERREGAAAPAINALNREGGLYDQLLETGKKIDFGSAKFSNAWKLYKQGAVIADPDISEYVNVLADTRAEFASVLSRGGQVTDSVRIAAEHAFPDKMSYGELQRNVERSKKVAKEIQAGNSAVADAIVNGTDINDALKAKPSSPPPPAGAPGAPSARGAGGGGGGAPVRVNTPKEAAALAPGTVFITPDGRRKVR